MTALLDDLKVAGARDDARRALEALPTVEWLQPLGDRIRRGDFRHDRGPRQSTFGVLAFAAKRDWHRPSAPDLDTALAELLIEGTRDDDQYVRNVSATAISFAPKHLQAVVVTALMPLLHHEDLTTARQAADSLGHIGEPASAAMPELLVLLQNPKPAFRLRVEATLAATSASDPQAGARLEETLRTSAAFARLRIGGVDLDLAAYPKLDAIGRAAAANALLGMYQREFYPLYDKRLPARTDREDRIVLQRRVTALLVDLFREPQVSLLTKREMLHAVGAQVTIAEIDPEVRSKACDLLALAAASEEPELRSVVERIEEELARGR
ncbi:MAG: HEAT repeat domain-containing protein [Planctomycetota bacterium]